MDHKGEFTLLVQTKLGKETADDIEWNSPRLLCIAGDFTRYDEYAVQQIDRNIELIRYQRYGDELLLFERANTPTSAVNEVLPKNVKSSKQVYKTVTQILGDLDETNTDLRDRYESLKSFLLALGEDVQINTLKYYLAFKRIKNFACVEFRTQQNDPKILVYVKVDPDSVSLKEGFTRDVRKTGHYGTGDLEITIRNDQDLDDAKEFLVKSYEAS